MPFLASATAACIAAMDRTVDVEAMVMSLSKRVRPDVKGGVREFEVIRQLERHTRIIRDIRLDVDSWRF